MAGLYFIVMVVAPCHADSLPCRDPNDKGCIQEYESRCKQAIESMLQTMRSTPVNTARDEERVRELISKVEKMLGNNRMNNVSECRSWSELGRIVANQ